jgi:multidrug efflux system membrane fusion protein
MNAHIPMEKTGMASSLRHYLIGGIALVLLMGGYWYFNQGGAPRRTPRSNAIPVRASVVERRDMAVVERTLGTVVPNTTVQVAARVQGLIDSTNFTEGQLVKKGDLLFVIDPRPYQAAYDNAVATLASTKAKADRYQKLLGQNAVAPQDEDDAQSAYLVAKSNAEAARLNLEFTHIRSPVDGKTGPILVQAGNMVSATTMTPLVTIDQIHPVKVSFNLPQDDLPLIQARQKSKGLTVHVAQQGPRGAQLEAPVNFTSNAVNNVSGTIELRSTFANDDDALVPGQLVNVTVQLDDIPNALVVPREAVNVGPDGRYVFVVADGKVVEKPVKVLFDDGASAAVTGDLESGEQVVTDGQLRLVPGAKVLVEGAKPALTGGAARGGKRGKKGGKAS